MKNLVSLGVFLLILLSVQVNAQEQSVLQIRPTGRILMDGGLFHSDNKNFVDGVAIPDARIGVKATYGKYKAKVDIGYAYGKVSLKDIFVERQFSSHALLRVGNFGALFGFPGGASGLLQVDSPGCAGINTSARLLPGSRCANPGYGFTAVCGPVARTGATRRLREDQRN